MPSATEHELGLATFLVPRRRERFVASLARGGAARRKETARLHDSPALDARHLQPATPPAMADALLAAVVSRVARVAPGVIEAYVVSGDRGLDARTLGLGEALRLAMAAEDGSLLSVIPGRVAVYTGELVDDIQLLVRVGDG